MSPRAARPCAVPGCPKLITGKACPVHGHSYDRARGNSAARGYDSRWRKIRAAKLAADPFCQFDGCDALANEVDHIDGNPRNNDPRNLRSACKPCHSRRTVREQGALA